mgnify:CR=1 FL=1
MVRTSIAAMEFDVRLLDGAGAEIVQFEDRSVHAPPYAVEVPADDAADLADVLPELINEQRDFDHSLEQRDALIGRMQRWLLLALITLVAVLATLGFIEV